jgi:hybrid cluster-associated redox disulfide protein
MATVAHFTKDLTVEQAFKTHAGARRVFARFHLGGCSHCSISETETIEQVSEGYGIPLNLLMDDLEKLFEQPALEVGDTVRLPDEIRVRRSRSSRASRNSARSPTGRRRVHGRVRRRAPARDFSPRISSRASTKRRRHREL